MRRVLQSQEGTFLSNTHHLVSMTITSESSTSAPPCSSSDLEEALHVLEGRWKILILYHLFSAPVMRLSELQRLMSAASSKMLVQQLRDLERRGVLGVADEEVRDAQRERVRRAPEGDALGKVAPAAQVLDRRQHSGADDAHLQDSSSAGVIDLNRTWSPDLRSAAGS